MSDDPSVAMHRLYEGLTEAGNDLARLAELAARVAGADACSLMQLDGDDDDAARMSVCASYGPLAEAAGTASVGRGEGLAGYVLATGNALVIDDIARSPYAHLARRATGSLIVVPIPVEHRIAGTLNASSGHNGFTVPNPLPMLELIALFAGKVMQTGQLQGVLASRFAQLALLRESPAAGIAYRDPGRMARVLAKSFYREMIRAGFASGQIVQAATEIISELKHQLTRPPEE